MQTELVRLPSVTPEQNCFFSPFILLAVLKEKSETFQTREDHLTAAQHVAKEALSKLRATFPQPFFPPSCLLPELP